MSKAWIPPGDYSRGVKEILYAPGTSSVILNDVLFSASTEDLKEALQILSRLQHTKTKRDRIKRELILRKCGDEIYKEDPWFRWFEEEWTRIRKAAGKKKGG